METSAGCTVSVAVPETFPRAAVIVVVPVPEPVASPPVLIVATEVSAEVQVTLVVMVLVLPSLYVPVAVYCLVVLVTMDELAGVTLIEVNAGGTTVSVVAPDVVPLAAVIVVVP